MTATRPELVDVAVRVLVANPSAALGEVAAVAGISRTTLHKHYPTRDDLLIAAGRRGIDLVVAAIEEASDAEGEEQTTRLAAAMVPLGAHLSLLWRTPLFDESEELRTAFQQIDARLGAAVESARSAGVVRDQVPTFWGLQAFLAYVYVAWECVESGKIAPLDAPTLVVRSLLDGLGPR